MDRKCLSCEKVFDAKRDTAKFCSVNCRVKWNYKNGKKDKVSKFDLKVVYNELLDLAQKLSAGTMPQPKVYDAPKLPQTFKDEPKQWQEPTQERLIIRNADQWHSLKRECISVEEWLPIKKQILSAPNLTDKQKQFIINTP